MDPIPCAQASTDAGEALIGTAPAGTVVWILLEHDGPWAPKLLESAELPGAAKNRLMAWEKAVPGSRLQLFRSDQPVREPRLMIAVGRPIDPFIVEWRLPDYDELTQIDLEGPLSGVASGSATIHRTPKHFVCTHGKRDACCAKWGVAVHREMAQLAPESVFQTTHVGGHRFAANVVSLPHGICYGRIEPTDGKPLIEAHGRGEYFDLEKLRGRACYDEGAQVADKIVREEVTDMHLEALELINSQLVDDQHRVRIADRSQRLHDVAIQRRRTDRFRPESCGKDPAPVFEMDVIAHAKL